MPEAKLPEKKNAYRFRGNAIDVVAKLPKQAASVIRRGGHVTVTVEWSESEERCVLCGGIGGAHGFVHERYGNGWGGNRACPKSEGHGG